MNANPTISVEERYFDSGTNERFVAILLWLEMLRRAHVHGEETLRKYNLGDIDQDLVNVVKKNPGIIGIMRSLGLEREVHIYAGASRLDPEDAESVAPEIKVSRMNLSAGKAAPVFIRLELQTVVCTKALPDREIPDIRSVVYVFDGSAEEFRVAVDELFGALDHLAFGYEDAGFFDMITAVSKMDRTTINDRSLIIRDIFGADKSVLPDIEVILDTLAKEHGHRKLTLAEKLAALEAAGPYRNRGFICRTRGLKTIRFNVEAYLADRRETGLLERDDNGGATAVENRLVEEGLKRLKLNMTFSKLIHIILHEAYVQNKFNGRGIYLGKKNLMMILGYGKNRISKYQEIRDALDVMRYFEYKIYDTDVNGDIKEREAGYFLTRIIEQGRAYLVDINHAAVGCVVNLGKSRLSDGALDRGYFKWSPILIYASRNFSQAGYLLALMLVSETGNRAIKAQGFKVVTFKLDTLYGRLQIGYSQPSKRYKAFLDAVKDVTSHGILCRIEPTLKVLLRTRPKNLRDISIRFFMHNNIEDTIADIYARISRS